MMLDITDQLSVPLREIELTAIRAQGPGGQNVNKVATAIHLRFDIRASSLPEFVQQRLLTSGDQRITRDGVIVIADAPGSAAWNGAESTWLQPALAAVRAGRMRQIDVSIGKHSFIVRRGWSWRRWRRVRPWWEYLG